MGGGPSFEERDAPAGDLERSGSERTRTSLVCASWIWMWILDVDSVGVSNVWYMAGEAGRRGDGLLRWLLRTMDPPGSIATLPSDAPDVASDMRGSSMTQGCKPQTFSERRRRTNPTPGVESSQGGLTSHQSRQPFLSSDDRPHITIDVIPRQQRGRLCFYSLDRC
jgi:hypothetical protein